MKTKLPASILLLLLSQLGALAQSNNKIVALINVTVFPTQINELKQKYEEVNAQFKDRYEKLQTMSDQLKRIEKEIKEGTTLSQNEIKKKQTDYDELRERGRREQEAWQAEIDSALDTATRPVRDKLYKFLVDYTAQRGIIMAINLSGAAQTGALAYWDMRIDVTEDFVAEYNKANPVGATANPPARSGVQSSTGLSEASKGTIALINTLVFQEQINEFKEMFNSLNKQFEPRVKQLQILFDRINSLELTIKDQSNTPGRIAEMQKDVTGLKSEYSQKSEELRIDGEKARDKAFAPLSQKLNEFAKSFTAKRNIVLLVDLGNTLSSGIVLAYEPKSDLTDDFIKEYNAQTSQRASSDHYAGPGTLIPKAQMAVLNTSFFQTKIPEYGEVVESVSNQFKDRINDLQLLAGRARMVEAKIRAGSASPSTPNLGDLRKELERLKREYREKAASLQADCDGAEKERSKSVTDKVMGFLRQYMKQREITLILDFASTLEKGVLIYYQPALDITDSVIQAYNKANPATGKASGVK